MLVFSQDAGGVLHRHVVATERNHLGSQFDVQGDAGRFQQRGGLVSRHDKRPAAEASERAFLKNPNDVSEKQKTPFGAALAVRFT